MRHLTIFLYKKAGQYSGLLLLSLILAGCGQSTTLGQSSGAAAAGSPIFTLPTSAPTVKSTPVNTRVLPLDSLTPSPSPTITPIPDDVRGLVVQVIDGNTIAVVLEGDSPRQAYEVRYLGIEAPPNTPGQPWGVVAYETNRKMTNLKVVRLVRDQSDLDDEGRLLRYVYVNNQLISIILAEQGLARAAISEPDTSFETDILEAEARAREGRLGIWNNSSPTATPTRGPPLAATTDGSTEPQSAPQETPEATTEPTDQADLTTPETTTPTQTPTMTVEPTATGAGVTVTATSAARSTTTTTPQPTPDEADSSNLLGPR